MAERYTAVHAPSALSGKPLLVSWRVDLLEVDHALADITVGSSATLVLDEAASLAANHRQASFEDK